MLAQIFVQEWPWWAGGTALGLFIVLYTWVMGRLFGMSGTVENGLREWKEPWVPRPANSASMDEAAWAMIRERGLDPSEFGLPAEGPGTTTAEPPDTEPPVEPHARVLIIGVLIGAVLGGIWQGTAGFSLGTEFHSLFPFGTLGQGAILLLGGFLIGFGARMAGGCPSGHALGGLSVLSPASFIAIAGYFVSGIGLTFALRWML